MILYLASVSPRRRELLEQIRVAYHLIPVEVDETPQVNELPSNYVKRLALAKARAGLNAITASNATDEKPIVLGADTSVICDGQFFGKPTDAVEAHSMLTQLSGRGHQVLTAVAVVTKVREQILVNVNTVYFRPLTTEEINRYIATGEPLDKAGSYAIQGYASVFIEKIEGSYSGVMGLPLYETAQLLAANGLEILPR